ncbi:MAG: hypothetical protein SGI84_01485 [Gemmatimonadota bacterium]|nr:hypothetical protein [Gemmatimonadota bacterium]
MSLSGLATGAAADTESLAAIRQWLADGRLPLPDDFRLSVARVPNAASLPPSAGPRIYETSELDVRASGDGGLHIWWRSSGAFAAVAPDRPEVALTLTAEAAARGVDLFRLFLMNVLILTLKRSGLYHLHAASARDPDGRDWLLAGDSCCGKSTTAAYLASRGWGVGTDDMTFLHASGEVCRALAWHGRIALRPGGQALLQAAGGVVIPERGKLGFLPEELGGHWVQTITPSYLLFPELGAERTWLEPVSAGAVLSRIVPWTFWVLFETRGADEYLEVLKRLATQTTAYRLHLGPDLFERPSAFAELLP